MINIYVGNLSYRATEQELRDLFAPYGSVSNASIITERGSGRSKGFGFVEMHDNSPERQRSRRQTAQNQRSTPARRTPAPRPLRRR